MTAINNVSWEPKIKVKYVHASVKARKIFACTHTHISLSTSFKLVALSPGSLLFLVLHAEKEESLVKNITCVM